MRRLVLSVAVSFPLDESQIASLPEIPQGRDQCTHFLAGVVEREGRAPCSFARNGAESVVRSADHRVQQSPFG